MTETSYSATLDPDALKALATRGIQLAQLVQVRLTGSGEFHPDLVHQALDCLYALGLAMCQLTEISRDGLHERKELLDEKARRIYYQDIVYNVCNQLDRALGGFTVCGSLPSPTTEVQDRLAKLIQERRCYFLEATKSEAGRRDRPATKPPEA